MRRLRNLPGRSVSARSYFFTEFPPDEDRGPLVKINEKDPPK